MLICFSTNKENIKNSKFSYILKNNLNNKKIKLRSLGATNTLPGY